MDAIDNQGMLGLWFYCRGKKLHLNKPDLGFYQIQPSKTFLSTLSLKKTMIIIIIYDAKQWYFTKRPCIILYI